MSKATIPPWTGHEDRPHVHIADIDLAPLLPLVRELLHVLRHHQNRLSEDARFEVDHYRTSPAFTVNKDKIALAAKRLDDWLTANNFQVQTASDTTISGGWFSTPDSDALGHAIGWAQILSFYPEYPHGVDGLAEAEAVLTRHLESQKATDDEPQCPIHLDEPKHRVTVIATGESDVVPESHIPVWRLFIKKFGKQVTGADVDEAMQRKRESDAARKQIERMRKTQAGKFIHRWRGPGSGGGWFLSSKPATVDPKPKQTKSKKCHAVSRKASR